MHLFRWNYSGPGSFGYGVVKCLKCPNSALRGSPLCQKCKEKENRRYR